MKSSTRSRAGALVAPVFLALLASHVLARAPVNDPTTVPVTSAPTFTPAAPDFGDPWHDVLYDEPGDGRLWARGETWKASFGSDGATYFPRVGPAEPRRLPHALSPDRVTI